MHADHAFWSAPLTSTSVHRQYLGGCTASQSQSRLSLKRITSRPFRTTPISVRCSMICAGNPTLQAGIYTRWHAQRWSSPRAEHSNELGINVEAWTVQEQGLLQNLLKGMSRRGEYRLSSMRREVRLIIDQKSREITLLSARTVHASSTESPSSCKHVVSTGYVYRPLLWMPLLSWDHISSFRSKFDELA